MEVGGGTIGHKLHEYEACIMCKLHCADWCRAIVIAIVHLWWVSPFACGWFTCLWLLGNAIVFINHIAYAMWQLRRRTSMS